MGCPPNPEHRVYSNERGHVLAYHGAPPLRPTLTVELYCKWYTLFLVRPDGGVEEVCFPGEDDRFPDALLPTGMSGCNDHVPNPQAVLLMAEHLGWDVDECAYEMMVGRHAREVREMPQYWEDAAKSLEVARAALSRGITTCIEPGI